MLKRIPIGVVAPVLLFAFAIYLRGHVAKNIAPYEAEWILWVMSTSVTSGALGWGLKAYWADVIEQRKRRAARRRNGGTNG